MKKCKFKVGDRVRVKEGKGNESWFKDGKMFTIRAIQPFSTGFYIYPLEAKEKDYCCNDSRLTFAITPESTLDEVIDAEIRKIKG